MFSNEFDPMFASSLRRDSPGVSGNFPRAGHRSGILVASLVSYSRQASATHPRREDPVNVAFIIGRVIVGVYFLFSSFNHFVNVKMMAGYAKSKGTPAPTAAILGTGILLLLGGSSILLGYRPIVGVALLVIFLVGVSFSIHNFWAVSDPQRKMIEQINFLKNMGLLGLLLMLLAIPQPWPISLGR